VHLDFVLLSAARPDIDEIGGLPCPFARR
jgi:hypothetical protein